MLYSMFGGNGISLPSNLEIIFGNSLTNLGVTFDGMFNGTRVNIEEGIKWIILLLILALYFPNSQQIVEYKNRIINIKSNIQLSGLGIVIGVTLYYICTKLSSDAEFLYFNF